MQTTGPFFVAGTSVFALVTDPDQWVKVKAITLDGAKRLAVKRATEATFSAYVAKRDPRGSFELVAALHDSSAITGRRAIWVTSKCLTRGTSLPAGVVFAPSTLGKRK